MLVFSLILKLSSLEFHANYNPVSSYFYGQISLEGVIFFFLIFYLLDLVTRILGFSSSVESAPLSGPVVQRVAVS